MTHTITTTMQPDKPIEVGDAEYLDLKRQGLIATDSAQASTPQAEPEQAAAPATATSKAAKSATTKEG